MESPRPASSVLGFEFKAQLGDNEVGGKVVSMELQGTIPMYKVKWDNGTETLLTQEQLFPYMESAKISPEKKRARPDAPAAPADLAAWEAAAKMTVDSHPTQK
eukprot:4463755-Pyramimonas_sp.AAC.1